MNDDIARVASILMPLERERLTGWRDVCGAAYNTVSEDLREMGLLNPDWSVSARGHAVAEYIVSKEKISDQDA